MVGGALAPESDARAFLRGVREMALRFFENGQIVHRPHMNPLMKWIAHADVSGFSNHQVKKIFVYAAVDEHAFRGAADLSRVEISAESGGFCGAGKIGVFKVNLRPVAAEFHQ